MSQVQRGTSNTISASFVDGERPVVVVSATLGVTSSDGSVIVEAGTEASAGTNEWTHVLPPVSDCDRLTATWVGLDGDSNQWSTVDTIEVAGGFYFPIQDLRSMPGMSDTVKYPTSKLLAARLWMESVLEPFIGTSFVDRFHEEDPIGSRCELQVRDRYAQRLLGLTIDGQALDSDDLAKLTFKRGRIVRAAGATWPTALTANFWVNATARYVGCYPGPTPESLRVASRKGSRQRLIVVDGDSKTPDRGTSMVTPDGTVIRLQMADEDHATGYGDEVDNPIREWRDRLRPPAIA